MKRGHWACACAMGLLLAAYSTAEAADWPQYRGINQDGISSEGKLLASWPAEGPPVLWRYPLGMGYSGMSVVKDKVYTAYGDAAGEYALCVDLNTHTRVWEYRLGELYNSDQGGGPRATPTVSGGKVYALSANGDLACLTAEKGEKVWALNILEKFGGANLQWGVSATPIVDGGKLLVMAGGPDGKCCVALNKDTGAVVWTSLNDRPSYAMPIVIDVDGMKQYVFFTALGPVGLAPATGAELWRITWETMYDVNAAQPIFHDNKLFIASDYNSGCALIQLSAKDGKATAEQLWSNTSMKNKFNTSVLVNGYLYGFDNNFLECMEFATGKLAWPEPEPKKRGFGFGSLTVSNGKLIILGDNGGPLALAEPSHEDYREISKATGILEGKCWTVPTVSDGRLLIRNETEMVCLDIRAK